MEVINVDLYGGKSIFGGRETPLEARVISCDKHKECSYYKSGSCLLMRTFGGTRCEFGKVQRIKGYTSRAKKYGEFKRKWKEHDQYNKLSAPPTKLGIIGDYIVFPYPYVQVFKNDHGRWVVDHPALMLNKKEFIPMKDFTLDLIYRICSFKPQAIMGGTITDYQKETVPLFLDHLKELLPDTYEAFIQAYPQFKEKEINYVGRKALLKTLKAPSLVRYKSKQYPKFNECWEWDGEYLRYKEGYVSSFRVTQDYDVVEIVLKPTDEATVYIESNDQVTEKTVFVD